MGYAFGGSRKIQDSRGWVDRPKTPEKKRVSKKQLFEVEYIKTLEKLVKKERVKRVKAELKARHS